MEDANPRSKGFFKKLRGLMGMSAEKPDQVADEIKQMVSEGHEKGALEADEAKMINNIFDFGDKEAADIMTHRKNIVGVEINMPFNEAARLMLKERFSRYPVYEGDIDNVVGILHLKDLLRAAMKYGENSATVRKSMRPPYFVPDTQNIDTLFKEMQKKKMHMAVVVDEYGQTSGIVAMEDILEEIVGNIFDEYDVEEGFIQKSGADTYIVKGEAPLDELSETLGVIYDEDEFDTLNGLMIAKLEHIPAEDEKVVLKMNGYEYRVLCVKNNMITSVEVRKLKDTAEDVSETEAVI